MNKMKMLSSHAVRRASSLGKLTAIEEKSLALSWAGTGSVFDSYVATGRVTTGPAQATCPHVEYPASA